MKYPFPSKLHKLLALILALVMAVGLVACSQNDDAEEDAAKYIVSTDNLNVRKNHNADSKVVSQLPLGLEIEILEEKTVDDTNWGRVGKMELPDGTKTKAGWINMSYVKAPGEAETEPPADIQTVSTEPPVAVNKVEATMGTVTAGKLNIRKGAGSGYEATDAYLKGDRIEILETKTVDDTVWGRTSKGWIGMGYVRMDGTAPTTSEDGDSAENSVISDGQYAILGYGVVDLGSLNVRSGPGTGYGKVCSVSEGTRYAYYQLSDGWVRIEDGWVSVDYFYMEGTTADDAVTGTVTTDDLNIRTGPSTSFKSNGVYSNGETIEILAQADGWGYTSKGWVSMQHVEPAEPTYTTGTGTITSGLNIRTEPNADSEIAGTYSQGEAVTITEVQGSWGKTDKGWINLKYIKYD